MVEILYLGDFKCLSASGYEVLLDETNDVVNVFYKNIKFNEVECFQIHKSYINTFSGNSLYYKFT